MDKISSGFLVLFIQHVYLKHTYIIIVV